ncbi:MAG: TIM barrel protein [Herpetosiphon sp.]
MLRFDVNVSFLFREYPFLERFDQMARHGFGAVEFAWPTGEDPLEVARRVRDAGLAVALFNFDGGDMPAGERGLLNDPDRQTLFRAHVPVALDLAARVGCTRMNALAGLWRRGEDQAVQLDRVRTNLLFVAEQAAAVGITVLIEALNTWDNGPYIFTNTTDTLHFIDSVAAPNIAYQYDVYHMHRMEGNVITTLRDNIGRIGHIQVADVPGRHHPGSGEIPYHSVFETIDSVGYGGSIGLEYIPLTETAASFDWLPGERRGALPISALHLRPHK